MNVMPIHAEMVVTVRIASIDITVTVRETGQERTVTDVSIKYWMLT